MYFRCFQPGTVFDIEKAVMKTGYLPEKVQEIEREEIVNAMKECGWIMSRAARRLGITERMIGYRIRKYSIRKEETEKEQTDSSKQQQEKPL